MSCFCKELQAEVYHKNLRGIVRFDSFTKSYKRSVNSTELEMCAY